MVLRRCTICDRKFAKTEHFKRHQRSRRLMQDVSEARRSTHTYQIRKNDLMSVRPATSASREGKLARVSPRHRFLSCLPYHTSDVCIPGLLMSPCSAMSFSGTRSFTHSR